jgi:ADP-ribose pyrophosphatase YjhB (NUDIX family)
MDLLRYCSDCGNPLERHTVPGELRQQAYCRYCDAPRVDHPMVVVTCFVACGQRLLWVQRALEPKRGLWAIPGGFLERGETMAEGAARELREETGIVLPPASLALYMTGTITFINQVYVAFRATLDSDDFDPGPEVLDCCFFDRQDCPWESLAYPEVNDCIEQAYSDLEQGEFSVWQAEMTSSHYLFTPVLETRF